MATTEIQSKLILSGADINKGRMKSIRLLTMFIGVLTAIATSGLFVLAMIDTSWQLRVLVLAYAACTGVSILATSSLYPKQRIFLGMGGTSLALGIALISTSTLLSGMGITAAVVYLIFTLIISASIFNEWHADLTITAGILVSGICALLTDFSPFPQLSINLVDSITPAILGLFIIFYIVMVARNLVTLNMRIRLVTAFLAIVMIPLILLPVIQSRFMFAVLNNELYQSLIFSARQTSLGIDKFLEDQEVFVTKAAQLDSLVRYLEISEEQRSGSTEEEAVQLTLQALNTQKRSANDTLSSFALLDLDGNILFDTLIDLSGGSLPEEIRDILGIKTEINADEDSLPNEGHQDYFLIPAREGVPYISPVLIPTASRGFFYISAPVKNKQNQTLGILRVRYDGLILQDLLYRYKGLVGAESYPILVDENNIRLADTFAPNNLYQAVTKLSEAKIKILKENRRLPDLPNDILSTDNDIFDEALNNYESQPFFMANINSTQTDKSLNEIGAITRIETMPWKVIYIQADFNDEMLRKDQRRLITLVTSLVAVFVCITAVVAARFLSKPILRLMNTARQIAQGNLDTLAPMHSSDEFGMLGASFNSMTSQLRMLVSQLEERVQSRTQEIEKQNEALSHRARQLQTVSEVARQIVTTQELDQLLESITHLISDRFDFYHVGIFLLDENSEYAVLRAANSEGGQRMLSRHHMLPVGKLGIVGYATGTGEVRISSDVGEDTVFFNNPDLPDTRSEIALPLVVGATIIGALDIQSTEPDSFHPEDIDLFETLADQVAIAIHNNRLYISTLQALKEAESLHRQYLRSEWSSETSHRKVPGYVYNRIGVFQQKTENPLWKQVFSTGEPVYAVLPTNNGSPNKAVMAIPIAIRGETIGVIQVQDQGDDRLWSEDEIHVVNNIANQVGVALENARLFENTVKRAEREKKVLQITAKIRATNDPEEMMKIAIKELQQALHATRAQIFIRQSESASGYLQEQDDEASNNHS